MPKIWAKIHLINGKLFMACGNRGSKFVYLKALGGACGAYGAGERGVQGSGVET